MDHGLNIFSGVSLLVVIKLSFVTKKFFLWRKLFSLWYVLFCFVLWKTLSHCIIICIWCYFYLFLLVELFLLYFLWTVVSSSYVVILPVTLFYMVLYGIIAKYCIYCIYNLHCSFCVLVVRKRWVSNSGNCRGRHLGLPLRHIGLERLQEMEVLNCLFDLSVTIK